MLSYMTDKEALQWKELYLKILTDQTMGNIVFPSYAKFLNDLKEAFKATDRTGEAMNKLTNLRQGNKTAEEVATEFQLLAGCWTSHIGENDPFRQSTSDWTILKHPSPRLITTNPLQENYPEDFRRMGC